MFYLIISLIIFNYISLKSINIIHNNYKLFPKNKIKILTFNCQRLPFLFRPSVNIENLIKEYDIICLQENFCSIFGINKYLKKNYNCIYPAGSLFKLVDSGLTIYSKYKIDFIDFICFNNLKSVDKLSDKGFMVIKLKDFFIINTHLQANYTKTYNNTAKTQLNTILEYIKLNNMEKVLICGDFNINLNELQIPDYNISIPSIPTHWEKINNSIFNSSSAEEKKDMFPCYFDGYIHKNINMSNISVKKIDKYSDHLGVFTYIFM
jgi:exonuclease III